MKSRFGVGVAAVLVLAAGGAYSAPAARAVFEQKGCTQCHAFVARGLGPSVKAMMRKFSGDPAKASAGIAAAKEHASDPLFKAASPDDLRRIADWLASDTGATGSAKQPDPPPEQAKPMTAAEKKAKAATEAAARRAAEVEARKEAAAAAKRQAEEKAAAKREAEERTKREGQARREAEARDKLDAEAKKKREAEAALLARRDAEDKARREAQSKRDGEELAKREAEARARKDTEALAALKREADERARLEAEQNRRDAEAKARRDAEAQAAAKREAEEKAKRESEAAAAQKRDAEEKAKREAEALAKREAEAKAKKEAEAQLAKQAEVEAKPKSDRSKMKAPEKFRDEPCPPITASAPVGTVDEAKAKDVIERVGCPQCHAYVQKKTGPPFKTVFQKVKDNPDCVIQRLKKNKEHNDEGVTADIQANEFKILADYLATRAK